MNLKQAIEIVTANNRADMHGAERPHNQSYMNIAIEILIHFAKANPEKVFVPQNTDLDLKN
jgi:hypothetical protein